jgi:hypothetical protein
MIAKLEWLFFSEMFFCNNYRFKFYLINSLRNKFLWREKSGIVGVEFDEKGKVIVAKKQPDFILTKTTN